MATLSEEITAASEYLTDFSRRYSNAVRPASHALEFGSSHLPPTGYYQLLGAMVHALDPRPRAGESYEARLRRIFAGKRILELGARRGVFVHFLREHGAEAEGIDANDHAASVARKLSVPVRTRRFEDLTDKKFDLVVSFQFFDPSYWQHRSKPNVVHKIANALQEEGHSVHVALDNESTIKREELERAGFRVLTHGPLRSAFPAHISIARKR